MLLILDIKRSGNINRNNSYECDNETLCYTTAVNNFCAAFVTILSSVLISNSCNYGFSEKLLFMSIIYGKMSIKLNLEGIILFTKG